MMSAFELLFLGTCACDYSPRLRTDCKDRFDADARRASSLLIDGALLVDCGPHCVDSMRIAGVDGGDVRDLFLTHLHSDHFNPENVQAVANARFQKSGAPLRVWVSEEAELPSFDHVVLQRMKKFVSYAVSEDFLATGVEANHDVATSPQHLVFEKGEKKLMYACDGAWMIHSTYQYLHRTGLDALIIDATVGDYEGDFRMAEHNSIPMLRMMLPSLRTFGILKESSRVMLSHIAPSLHKSHAETAALVARDGMEVACDGWRTCV